MDPRLAHLLEARRSLQKLTKITRTTLASRTPHLDRDIETWEVRQAAQDLNCRSAAGPDKVTNKALRNLSDAAITSLTRYYNDCWRDGRHKKKASQEAVENIVVRTSDGVPIPHVPGLRILGMFVDGTQTNATAVKNITTKMGVAARLIKRVSSRYRGMNERGLLRLLQAFVVSQAAYAGAFHRWTCAERAKIDAAIRKAYTGGPGTPAGHEDHGLAVSGSTQHALGD
ncbi:hypothetical protein MTO96_028637 [Rhipicephalus appendiculatus]